MSPTRDKKKRRSLKRLSRWLAIALGCSLLAAGAGIELLALYLGPELPDVRSIDAYRDAALQSSRVYDRDGELVHEFWRERRRVVEGEDIAQVMKDIAVVAEDSDFFSHAGFDVIGILRAAAINLRDGRFSQGASTITQQLARSFHLTHEKSLERKVKEVFLARKLEQHLTKHEILELYLNQIYFGHGRWGVAEAARFYFGVTPDELSLAQSATLMALVPSPERLNPFRSPKDCTVRRHRILERAEDLGVASRDEVLTAKRTPLPTEPVQAIDGSEDWFIQTLRTRLRARLGGDELMTGGYDIFTTLDQHAQRAAHDAIFQHLGDSVDAPEAAFIALDSHSREVRALVGSRHPGSAGFNRATQARRQAGSVIKPFVYASALESGILMKDSLLLNAQRCYRGKDSSWCPKNANGVHDNREVGLQEALSLSINVTAVHTLQRVGVSTFTDLVRRSGISSPIPNNLTAALGSGVVSPLEITNAYATIASGGLMAEPLLIRRVQDARGRVVFSEPSRQRRAWPQTLAAEVRTLLGHVVKSGTGRRAQIEGAHTFGKTGTTDGGTDAWFVGFGEPEEGAASITAGVWVGFDNNRGLPSGTGGRTAAPIWRDAMSPILERLSLDGRPSH